jgi:hypothetical protein
MVWIESIKSWCVALLLYGLFLAVNLLFGRDLSGAAHVATWTMALLGVALHLTRTAPQPPRRR